MEFPTPLIGNWPWLHYDEDQVDITNHFSIQIHIANQLHNSLTYTYVYSYILSN